MDQPRSDAPPAWQALDTTDADQVIDAFHRAAEANLSGLDRRGSLVHLPDRGRLLLTGDLHDHAQHFRKILKLADLDAGDDRFLVLHEIVHGPHYVNGRDLSVRLLAQVAALKADHPDRVVVLQSNHDLAQLTGERIIKDGLNVIDAFEQGLAFLYGDADDDVRAAMNRFIRSYPLAARCANGILVAHSLPAPRKLDSFDTEILDRPLTEEDLNPDGSVYSMVWGRYHTQKVADELSEAWGARLFVLGHQPAEMGFDTEADRILILNSNHEHGVALPVDLSRRYDLDGLVEAIVPLGAVTL